MIALYQGTSAVSRLIRWRTWSDYSHAAWVCRDGSVIEAWHVGKGVRRVAGLLDQHTPGTQVDLFDVQGLDDGRRYDVETFLLAQLGKPYDFAGIMGFVAARRVENPQKWFCSELIFAALQSVGIDILARIPAWKVTPGLLLLSPTLTNRGRGSISLAPSLAPIALNCTRSPSIAT